MIKQIIKLGHYQPTNANWSYRICAIIDNSGVRLYKSTFGQEKKIIDKYNLKQYYSFIPEAKYKYNDVKKMLDITEYNGINYKELKNE